VFATIKTGVCSVTHYSLVFNEQHDPPVVSPISSAFVVPLPSAMRTLCLGTGLR